ncbi:Aste57867_8989 [Aphanomyces stellatus]|uniref:Aste57867_8989 protein n=1 Tax=Aphanomyces stellatus TaxID=120398 RepID=A0A485KLW7_9STRA|nr:hypothetical protein As57867_008954 [Aphanomyces stellatus]VFT85873.1 Aste57867_8989 [Aphanomyces stellatus]
MVVVQDAETGEWIEVDLPSMDDDDDHDAVDNEAEPAEFVAAATTYEKAGMFTPFAVGKQGATQSTRKMGTLVGWEHKMERRRQNGQAKVRESLHGLQRQLANPKLSSDERSRLQIRLLDVMKTMYKRQQEATVKDELEREEQRGVAMHAEKSEEGRARLKRQFDRDRGHYRAQIERIKEECNLALTATMEKFNMLR